jgi:succinate dehydrogenase hydrophobic anchor subunit
LSANHTLAGFGVQQARMSRDGPTSFPWLQVITATAMVATLFIVIYYFPKKADMNKTKVCAASRSKAFLSICE